MAAVDAARARAQAVLRVRGLALAVAALPAALAVVLLAGRITGRLGAPGSADSAGWDAVRWVVCAVAAVTLLAAYLVARAHARAVPPRTPAVPVEPADAPELYRLINELAERLEVPAPAAIALTPDCDSWLEDAHPRLGVFARRPADPPAPVLVIGSPFLWWMRAGELRALLAPVVAGTAAAVDPEIAAARRFVRSLDAALGEPHRGPAGLLVGRVTRTLLSACREHSAELERAVAGWASDQAKAVDYGLRIAAQEQVGLAYAGWDRLLTRVALPAWRLGRHPAHLDAGVVAALTELSRRDRLADGYESRLGDRPACDLLEEPGEMDAAVSLLAAELFFGDPPGPARDWQELDWDDYPAQVADRGWRVQAAALQAALDGPGSSPGSRTPAGPTLTRLLARLADGDGEPLAVALSSHLARTAPVAPPLQPARSGRDLLVEHVAATVCCAVLDTGIATPGLDWLDGPVLLIGGVRRSDLAIAVAQAVEQGKDAPLRAWLEAAGVRLERPVRL
ncbi:hypothetical protein [Kitasatospora sp. MAP5-34]|uniref:hypothetical protein n=1 Tax=Kitasatospora sp. MAP5-34 TaxID=3035102 RepID=UPI0024737ABF|nr:hypothetical protein [Kitasatospora sp. MAP5-34]MDH6580362.1 hypothetical protein [Kitasatospora sp. MAP5-34]